MLTYPSTDYVGIRNHLMRNQDAKFDVVDTLALIAQATQFWQSLDPQKLEDMCDAEMDNSGAPIEHKAA